MSFANGSWRANKRFHFLEPDGLRTCWKISEGPACDFTIEAWAKRAYLVQEDRRTHEVQRYEIMNCTYRELSGENNIEETRPRRDAVR